MRQSSYQNIRQERGQPPADETRQEQRIASAIAEEGFSLQDLNIHRQQHQFTPRKFLQNIIPQLLRSYCYAYDYFIFSISISIIIIVVPSFVYCSSSPPNMSCFALVITFLESFHYSGTSLIWTLLKWNTCTCLKWTVQKSPVVVSELT